MNLDYKRLALAILLLIIGIGLIAGIFWFIFLRSEADLDQTGGSGSVIPGGGLPDVGPGQDPNIISQGGGLPGTAGSEPQIDDSFEPRGTKVQADDYARGSFTFVRPVVGSEAEAVSVNLNQINYLDPSDSKFYRVGLDGLNKVMLSDHDFGMVEQVYWSPDGQKAILEYPDGANIVYDFSRDKRVTLPRGLQEPVWSQDSNQMAYKYVGGDYDTNWLMKAKADGSGSEAIEHMGDNYENVQSTWSPTGQVAAFYKETIGLNKEEIFLIGFNHENFESLEVDGIKFKGVWSPEGGRVLYHVIDINGGFRPVLWIVDAYGSNIGRNNFNLGLNTWVDKCVFANMGEQTIYCAVPAELPEGAGLYPELFNDSEDLFYKVDLNTGISSLLAYPITRDKQQVFQAKKLFISNDNRTLYFWDDLTARVYDLRLK